MTATLDSALRWWATEQAHSPAIVFAGKALTYAELDRWVTALAGFLRDRGLQRGDRVVILAANSVEWCVLARSIIRAGGIVAPLHARFAGPEIEYLVGHYQPRFIFADEPRLVTARQIALPARTEIYSLSTVREQRNYSTTAPAFEPSSDDRVAIIATSGSTARPKGVAFSHRTMLSYVAEFALQEPDCRHAARVFLVAPLSTNAGFVVLTQFLTLGATIYLEEAFEPAVALRRLLEDRINVLMGAPIFFERIAACADFQAADLSHLRIAHVGGARVEPKLLAKWMERGALLRQIYGQTEAGGTATINTRECSVSNPEKCGRGGMFTEVCVIDPDGNVCPPHVPGEIVIRGPAVMVEYWSNPEGTAAAIVDGWLRTGDLGVLDEAGMLTMLDRMRDIIISGGLNISAAEIERVVSEIPGIDEVAVIAAFDERFGETPLAVIHALDTSVAPRIVQHCSAQLADFKVPRYVAIERNALPRLATGKIDKPTLRTRYAQAHLHLPRLR
ncbi:MAG: AMP-binding protein [Steroidobacteraceae bacterium]